MVRRRYDRHLRDYVEAEAASSSDLGSLLAQYLKLAGGTMTGKILLDGDPTADLHPVTKQFYFANLPASGGLPAALFPYEQEPASPSSLDDEFEGAISGSWTVVAGSSGTVDPTASTGAGMVYDVTTLSKGMLVQPDASTSLELRQDYTLPDGKAVIVRFCPSLLYDGYPDNELRIFLVVNDDDADYGNLSGGRVSIFWDTQANFRRFFSSSNSGTNKSENNPGNPGAFYMAIGRDGTDYYTYFCGLGGVPCPMAKYSVGSVLDNVWIAVDAGSSIAAPLPVSRIDWIREADFVGGANSFYAPWP